jgi:hypothetical protein
MSAPVQRTQLYQLHQKQSKMLLAALDGEIFTDSDGKPVIIDGEPLRNPPSPATFREVREFLALNGIDEEPIEGSGVIEVAKRLEFYDDEGDPLLEG